ncbi:MAG TPA: hypothetical protein PLW60_03175 [Bacilli bacterium]|nr:hypothetical protein [Bacilli bacterium]
MKFNLNDLFNRSEDNKFPFFSHFFVTPAGAYIILGLLIGFANIINRKKVVTK